MKPLHRQGPRLPLKISGINTFCILFLLLIAFMGVIPSTAYSQSPLETTTPQPVPGGDQKAQDPAVAELQKEKLELEVEKLQIENANAERNVTTTRGWLNLLYANVAVSVAIVLGFIGLFRYLRERREELLKREDERFEEVVKGLGDEQPEQRVSSAVLLPTFLRPGYKRFYRQVFNLAAGNLRTQTKETATSSPTPLIQALVSVMRESYPLARDALKDQPKNDKNRYIGRFLNAAGVNLDRAFLDDADFRVAWLRGASFREAALRAANFTDAMLEESDCSAADLENAILCNAIVKETNFTEAALRGADLSSARADGAKFNRANLAELFMEGGTIGGADFTGADLSGATFRDVVFSSASPNTPPANPEAAAKLENASFEGIIGLTDEQITQCKQNGATVCSSAQPRAGGNAS